MLGQCRPPNWHGGEICGRHGTSCQSTHRVAKTSTTHCRCTCWPMAIMKLGCTLPTSQVGSARPTFLLLGLLFCFVRVYSFLFCQGLLFVLVGIAFLPGIIFIFCQVFVRVYYFLLFARYTNVTDVPLRLSVEQLLSGKAPCWTSKRCTVGQRCI